VITKEDTVLQLFPIPGLITKYPSTFKEEFKFIKNLEYIGKRGDGKGGGNFKTKDSYILRHKKLSKIKDFIYESLNKFTTELWKTKQKVIITQSWCNKNPPNTEHPFHHHPNSIISGVFYFKQNPTLPPIQVSRVDRQILVFKEEEWNIFNSDHILFPMVDGELILFPSTLRHAVLLNKGKDVRYSMSFNTFANELGSEDSLTELKLQELNVND
jgi:uncharacterized protein (TIGR02466 family)